MHGKNVSNMHNKMHIVIETQFTIQNIDIKRVSHNGEQCIY